MAWWQVVLILLGSIAVGLAVGYGLYIAIVKVGDRVKVASARRAEAWAAAAPKPSMGEPAAVKPNPAPVKPNPAPPVKTSEPHGPESSPADLIAEVELNRRAAAGTWNGKLQAVPDPGLGQPR